jgi:hypothetical protein
VWRASVLLISISPARVDSAVLQRGRWVSGSARSVSVGTELSVLQALQTLSEQIDTRMRVGHVQVRISDALLAAASLPWSTQGMGTDVARTQLLSAGFTLGADDVIAIDDAPFGQTRLAVAYPQAWLSALHALAGAVRGPLRSVLPWSAAAWHLLKPTSALALVQGDTVLLARSHHHGAQRLAEVTVRSGQAQTPAIDTLRLLWQRVCLRDAAAAQLAQLPVLHLEPETGVSLPAPLIAAPWPKRWHDPDIVAPLQLAAHSQGLRYHGLNGVPQRSTLRAWQGWTLALALGCTALLLTQTWGHYQAAQQQQAQRKATSNMRTAAPPSSKPWSRQERAAAQAVNTAVRSLNLPITALMTALQPPPNLRVALLQVDFAGGAAVKVTAQARSSEEMTRYVASIAQQRPFTAAYLTSHDLVTGGPEKTFQFTLEAQWIE